MIIASYPWWAWIALGAGIGFFGILGFSLLPRAKKSDDQEQTHIETLRRWSDGRHRSPFRGLRR